MFLRASLSSLALLALAAAPVSAASATPPIPLQGHWSCSSTSGGGKHYTTNWSDAAGGTWVESNEDSKSMTFLRYFSHEHAWRLVHLNEDGPWVFEAHGDTIDHLTFHTAYPKGDDTRVELVIVGAREYNLDFSSGSGARTQTWKDDCRKA
jgi:hypothetical protein